MQFKNNAEVFTSDGQEVGRINRVVLDPVTKEVTHVIIQKGLLFSEDKVVPIDLVTEAEEDRVTLQNDNIDSLPDFEESHFIALDGEELPDTFMPGYALPMYWYPFGTRQGYQRYIRHLQQPYVVETERNIPEQTVALKEGAKVMSADDEYVGDIERVFVNPDTDRVMTFLVSKGLLLKEKMLIPSAWVSRFDEREVQLAVGSKLLEKQSRLLETWQDLEELAESLS
jgi:uncharacterized protein YrrD